MFEKLFKLKSKGSNVKTEIIAGITTFLTMAYILGVNPGMLASTGMSFQSVFLATAFASGVASIIMGLLANYPVGLAPGMGVNAFFTYTVCMTFKYTWQEALAAVLISGVIFLIISVTGVRKAIINSIPKNMKLAIGAGIGFFIAFIGLKNAGIVVADPSTYVAMGNLTNPTVILACFGLIVTVALLCKKVNAAVFYGMIITAVVGVVAGLFGVSGMPALPTGIVSFDFSMPTFGACFEGISSLFSKPSFIMVIFTFLFIDFFDTAGTLVAVGNKIGLVNDNGEMENIEKALVADSVGTCVGAVCGTSTVTSFVESGSGVAAGGRTGLTACTTGVLFFLSILFMPLLTVVNSIQVGELFLSPVTSAPLIIVGVLMAQQLKEIEWDDISVAVAAFTTVITMVLTYSISNGIAVGFVFYVVSKVFSGKAKEINPITWVLLVIFLIYLVLL
ncbi:NCS2 family permease [uncultured Anaerofustis sp.]|uniref:NCS2 family permease n=1 Tax=uncultured Anaerofustis sp. TaxID=904996 RepID=UPI0025F27D8B|nr:NCS2 family permease [uncultured Anaerofustis sp.]